MSNFLRALKWLALILLFLLVLIVGFQNLTPIELHFLFWTIQLPQAVTVVTSTAIGFILGLVTSALWRVRSARAKLAEEKKANLKNEMESQAS